MMCRMFFCAHASGLFGDRRVDRSFVETASNQVLAILCRSKAMRVEYSEDHIDNGIGPTVDNKNFVVIAKRNSMSNVLFKTSL